MPEIKSCGFLIYRDDPRRSFLLMRHPDRWDLPKGHVDPGESDLECALRELEEETGIFSTQIAIQDSFQFTYHYTVNTPRHGNVPKPKVLIIFLAKLLEHVEIVLTEHDGFEWFDWNPPHQIQTKTIDPLLNELDDFWNR